MKNSYYKKVLKKYTQRQSNTTNIMKNLFILVIIFSVACKADKDYPGTEYAPQMYHSIPYEPLTQITEEGIPNGPISSRYYLSNSLPHNDYDGKEPMNMLRPVEGTVPRMHENYKSYKEWEQQSYLHEVHKDSFAMVDSMKNPIEKNDEVLANAKELYLTFCSPCHGEKGDGQGKVGAVYGGVASYTSRAVVNLSEGHIFHVITHGIRRMWPHKSLLNPEERWTIVHYVKELQQGKQ